MNPTRTPMNTHNTIEKMTAMRMKAMAAVYHQAVSQHLYSEMDQDEFTALMIDYEWEDRQHRRIGRLLSNARFQQQASARDLDFTSTGSAQSKDGRKLDRTLIERLLSLGFIKHRENIIITGPTGVGKSYLAQAIGVQACQMLHRTMYFTTSRLLEEVKLAKMQGTYLKMMELLIKQDLLILDDFGLCPMDATDRQTLLEIVEGRHQKHSTIISSQIPVAGWHALIGEGTMADAILDRIVNTSHRIQISGDSLRKNQKLS